VTRLRQGFGRQARQQPSVPVLSEPLILRQAQDERVEEFRVNKTDCHGSGIEALQRQGRDYKATQ
jgi:hypothetical protein